jgi:MoaE-MoaD fusion protein
MRVRMLYFASVRERAGAAEDLLELPEGARLVDAVEEALARRPGLGPLGPSVRLARNHSFEPPDAVLADGDELALIPPVSGG